MLAITTNRLRLLPLTTDQLRLYLTDLRQLEVEMKLKASLMPAEQALRRALGLKLEAMAQVEEDLLPWFTYWLIVVVAEEIGAGLVGFKGAPDESGQVEIGYGIEPAQRQQGIATEAVRALVQWALDEPSCQTVIAHTEATNIASAAVLRKASFYQSGSEEGQLIWRTDTKIL